MENSYSVSTTPSDGPFGFDGVFGAPPLPGVAAAVSSTLFDLVHMDV